MTIGLKSWGLRIHGPCSICDLAEHVHHERQAVYSAVYQLRRDGLADRLGPASYDVTEAGRAHLAALAVDRVVTTPAVRQLDLF